MARILITSGPTRQYLDPVRYLSNASSGRMGCCLAEAALDQGHDVVIVTGPVEIRYPSAATVIVVVTTEQMLAAAIAAFPDCDGLIGAAAPCDYRPREVAPHKLAKTGQGLLLDLVETDDIVATLGDRKNDHQWTVGFALETEDTHHRALAKLYRKKCDLVVLNGAAAINADDNSVEILDPDGNVVRAASGPKSKVASAILEVVQTRLMDRQIVR